MRPKIFFYLSALSILLYSCEKQPAETEIPEDSVKAEQIALEPQSLTLTAGDTVTVSVIILPENAMASEIKFSSDDEHTASVSQDGIVIANNPGNTQIKAEMDDLTAVCDITVLPPEIESIIIEPSEIQLTVGDSETLKAVVMPENAVASLTWSSSAPKIAEVDENGTVSAISPGTATITAETSGRKAQCTVTVENPEVKVGDYYFSMEAGAQKLKLERLLSQ